MFALAKLDELFLAARVSVSDKPEQFGHPGQGDKAPGSVSPAAELWGGWVPGKGLPSARFVRH